MSSSARSGRQGRQSGERSSPRLPPCVAGQRSRHRRQTGASRQAAVTPNNAVPFSRRSLRAPTNRCERLTCSSALMDRQGATAAKNCDLDRCEIVGPFADHPAFAFSPAASMPANAQISSLSDVSPLTPTAPSRPPSPMISTPPGTGTRRPCAIVFTASMK